MDLMGGQWCDVIGWEGYYRISEYGVIISCSRAVWVTNRWGDRKTRNKKEAIHISSLTKTGYLRTILSNNAYKETWSVHRIVAMAFLPNPMNLPQVNHIDGNKLNNHISNLEWCDQFHNQRHAARMKLNVPKKGWDDNQSKAIAMFDVAGVEIKRFGSMGEAKRETGIPRSCIRRVCVGKREFYKNYKFQFLCIS